MDELNNCLSTDNILELNGLLKNEEPISNLLFNVKWQFILRKPKSKQPTYIYFEVSYQGKRTRLKLYGIKVNPACWNKTFQRALVSKVLSPVEEQNNRLVNLIIEGYINKFEDFVRTYQDSDTKEFHNELKTYMRSKRMKKDFVSVDNAIKDPSIRVYSDSMDVFKHLTEVAEKSKKTGGHIQNLKLSIKAFESFSKWRSKNGKEKIVSFSQIDARLFNQFQDWINEGNYTNLKKVKINGRIREIEEPYGNTTLNDIKIRLKALLRKVSDDHISPETKAAFSTKGKKLKDNTDQKGNEIALTDEEVLKLWNYIPTDEVNVVARDLFLLSCLIGIRGEELSKLNEMFELTDDGRVYVTFFEKKTHQRLNSCRVLFKIAEEIIFKYKINQFPLTNCHDRVKKRIKTIAKAAGIKGEHKQLIEKNGQEPKEEIKERCDLVVGHTGRRTFVTMLSLRGWTYSEIAQYSGHATEEMVRHYDKSSPRMRDDFNRLKPEERLEMTNYDPVPLETNSKVELPNKPKARFAESVEDAEIILKFLGVETKERELGSLISIIKMREKEILDICEAIGLSILEVKDLFNDPVPLEDRCTALRKLVLSCKGKEELDYKSLF